MSQLTKLLSDRISFIDNSSNTGELVFESDLFNINKSVNFSSNISASNITVASGGLEIVDYNTAVPTTANSGKLYKATNNERIHWLTNTNDSVLAYKTEVDSKAGRTVSTDNPTSGDDVNDGYSIGDIWVNEEGTQSFICVNNSVDAAEWELFGNDQSLNTNDSVSFTSVDTPAISSSSGDVTVSSPLIVDNTIKLNNNILDTNGNQSYILKKQTGNNSYAMGNLTYTGTGADNLSIGYDVGNSLQTGIYNVFIGNNSAKSINRHRYGVVIGNGCANAANGDSIVAIGNTAGLKMGSYSICIGRVSGFDASGTNNIIMGNLSGTGLKNGNTNIFIGYNSGCTTAAENASGMIGILGQTTAANQCVIGGTDLAQFQSDGFRDLDTKSANVLGIGKTNATKVEIAKTGVITEVKGDLMASGGVEIRDYTTSAPTDALSGKLYKAASDERIHWLTNTNDSVLAYKTEVDSKAGRTVSTEFPTADDDVDQGYSIGDIWVNEEGTQSFICVNNSVGLAEWELFGNDQSLNTNDNVSFTSVNTPAISSWTDVTVSSPLIVDNTIKFKNLIYDANGDEAYIFKKQTGANSYAMGNLAYNGIGDKCVSIGYDIGKSTQTGNTNVIVGINSGKSSGVYNKAVIIGPNSANAGNGDNVIAIGNVAGPKIGSNSICIGMESGFNASGIHNIIIGRTSGMGLTTGNSNIFMGFNSGCTAAAATGSGMIGIGYNAQTTASNQCVIGSTNLQQFLSNGFRDLDTKSANVLGIGKTNATKVEIAKTGVTTEVKGDLTASGGVEIRDYTTSAPTDALSGKLYKAASDERIHWLTNTNDSVLAYKTEVDSKAGRTVSTEFPSANDDVDQGYSIGDIWVNEEGTQSFICVNNSVGLAEWELFGNDQSLNTNDNVSFNSVNTPAISSSSGDVTVSSPLIVDNTIKLNNNILDTNGDEAYILKKQTGNNSYAMGNLTYTGTGDNNLSIGYDVGSSLQTGIYNVVIGNRAGKSSDVYSGAVIIGAGAANSAKGDSVIAIGNSAGPKIGAASVCIGRIAGFVASGNQNVLIGNNAGWGLTTGNNNVFIGWNSGCLSTIGGSSNMICIAGQTTAANQCVIGGTSLQQFLSDGFRDLDTQNANVLGIGKTNATKVEIAKTGITTEVKGDLTVGGKVNGLTPIGGVFAQTTTVSITSLAGNTEQSLVGSGVGSLTVPANTFKVGDSYSLKIRGTKTNNNNDTIQIIIRAGLVIIAQSGLISLTSLSSLSAEPYEIKLEFTIRAVGGAGVASVSTSGIFTYTDAGVYKGYNFNQINSTTFNTTVDNTLGVTVTQSAGNNMTSSSFILTKIY